MVQPRAQSITYKFKSQLDVLRQTPKLAQVEAAVGEVDVGGDLGALPSCLEESFEVDDEDGGKALDADFFNTLSMLLTSPTVV